jgi:hypothetical protein
VSHILAERMFAFKLQAGILFFQHEIINFKNELKSGLLTGLEFLLPVQLLAYHHSEDC